MRRIGKKVPIKISITIGGRIVVFRLLIINSDVMIRV